MADIHLRALHNTPEQIRAGMACASLDAISDAGKAALGELLPRFRYDRGPMAVLSTEAITIVGRLEARGLTVRFN